MAILNSSLQDIKEYSFDSVWFHTKSTYSTKKRTQSRRKKRELSSTFAKILFGTSSNEKSAEQVNVLKLKTVENLLLIEKHTTLFEDLLDIVNNSMQFQSGLHSTLQHNFRNLTVWLDGATNRTISTLESHELYTKFIELSFILMFSILEFRENQRKLFEAITNKSGIIHLIPPKIFQIKLSEISASHDANGFQLPLPLNGNNLPTFYEITTTESQIINNTFVVRFSVPLVENRQYILYKVMSIPYRNTTNDLYNFVVTRHEFIGIDTLNTTFVTLMTDDVKKCHQINDTNLLCYLSSPIHLINNNLNCEINLLLKSNLTSNCEFRTDELAEELWLKLEQPNTYLYTLPKIVPIDIQCIQSNDTLFLQDSGVISLKSGCKMKTNLIELITFHSIEACNNFNFTIIPKVNISSHIAAIRHTEHMQIPSLTLPNYTINNDWIKIQEIKHNLQSDIGVAIDAAEKVLGSVVSSDKSVNEIILTLAVIVITIAIIYTCIKYSVSTGISILVFIVLVGVTTTIVLYVT